MALNREAFYAHLRADKTLFGSGLTQGQVDGIEGLFDFWEQAGTGIDRQLGYILGTVYHETARRMSPVRETLAKSDAEARRRLSGARYGKPAGPYGHVYYGRGQVQLTWHSNYVNSSADAGVDLERFPDKMLDPKISARITILGMLDGRFNGRGKGLGSYITASRADYKNARRTVNITDKWELIRDHSKEFEAAIAAARRAGDVPDNPKTQGPKLMKILSNIFGLGGLGALMPGCTENGIPTNAADLFSMEGGMGLLLLFILISGNTDLLDKIKGFLGGSSKTE